MSTTVENDTASQAKETAIRFLQQHYSVSDVKNQTLDEKGIWTIEAFVTSYDTHQTKRIRINSKTGRIVEYW